MIELSREKLERAERLAAELRHFADKPVGSLRIDVEDVRTILAIFDAARAEGPAGLRREGVREEIARIVDPTPFASRAALYDYCVQRSDSEAVARYDHDRFGITEQKRGIVGGT